MNACIICSHCKQEVSEAVLKELGLACECGTWYCSFSCLVRSLHKIGVNQCSFDELDKCGQCAVEKLKAGRLVFPQGKKHLNGLLAPHLLIYAIGEVKQVKRKKKVSENQLSLF